MYYDRDFSDRADLFSRTHSAVLFDDHRSTYERQQCLDELEALDCVGVVDEVVDIPQQRPGSELYECEDVVHLEGEFVVDSYGNKLCTKHDAQAYYASSSYMGDPDGMYHSLRSLPSLEGIVIPLRGQLGGQLKIFVDFALGVDHLLSRGIGVESNPGRILVIGSSGESGVAGLSYNVLPLMEFFGEIDLYDPFEVSRVEKRRNVVFRYHKASYNYVVSDIIRYHFIFDDAFNVVGGPFRLSPVVDHAQGFSVKMFSSTVTDKGYRYVQATKTDSSELRCVSYFRAPHKYKAPEYGQCALCFELTFRMNKSYSKSFEKYVQGMHKKPCRKGFYSFYGPDVMCSQLLDDSKNPCRDHARGHKFYRVPWLSTDRVQAKDIDHLSGLIRADVELVYENGFVTSPPKEVFSSVSVWYLDEQSYVVSAVSEGEEVIGEEVPRFKYDLSCARIHPDWSFSYLCHKGMIRPRYRTLGGKYRIKKVKVIGLRKKTVLRTMRSLSRHLSFYMGGWKCTRYRKLEGV